jgi:hypothetical protein
MGLRHESRLLHGAAAATHCLNRFEIGHGGAPDRLPWNQSYEKTFLNI